MTYLVEFTVRAVRDLEILYVEKNAAESHAAARWYNNLEQAVYALATRRIKRKLRHLLYGKKPHVYRVIYEVDEKWRAVLVLAVRHGARRRLKASDLM
jgi:plasmid stabilization system protein ParE